MIQNKNKMEKLISRFFASWILAVLLLSANKVESMLETDFIKEMSLLAVCAAAAGIFLVLTAINIREKSAKRDVLFLLLVLLVFGMVTAYAAANIYVALGLGAVCIAVVKYFIECHEQAFFSIRYERADVILMVGTMAFVWLAFVIGFTILRYLAFKSPCYDMGIFSQKFYYMKENLTADTTCERAKLLSHFNVHMSPALYLLLPFYALFPSPVTLLVLQGLMIASGAIPLYLIAKKKNLNRFFVTCVLVLYFLFPASAGGCFYDFHENKMLLPIVLWLLYFIEQNKSLGIWVFMVLTLLVKEDAAIYVACIGLFLMAARKQYRRGFVMFGVSVVYFLAVVYYLEHFGDGAMLGRYSNFIIGDGGVFSILVTILKDPSYLFSQVFTMEKMEFVLLMIVPLLGMPFFTKRISHYILLIPFLVINLMTDNPYQHSIYYQYTYGVTALLFYLTVLHLSEWEEKKAKKMAVYAVILSLFVFVAALADKTKYLDFYEQDKEKYQTMMEVLDQIPKEKSVRATTCLVPYMSQRKVIYKFETTEELCDVIAFDLIYESSNTLYNENKDRLLSLGYKQVYLQEMALAIFEKEGTN